MSSPIDLTTSEVIDLATPQPTVQVPESAPGTLHPYSRLNRRVRRIPQRLVQRLENILPEVINLAD